jgi:glyoxylase-like metal-dependent hydrolase (beta-lactamase superfamily II)
VIEPARDLLDGVTVRTDLGEWIAYETPGHSPSHVCLFQPERRLLISGDHLLGRISLYFEYGNSPDPVGEFLHSLDTVQRLGARLCLPGHGRTFADVHAHIEGNRKLVHERLQRVREALAQGPLSAFEIVPRVYGDALSEQNAQWLLSEMLSYLKHLEALGDARLIPGEPERWAA